MSDLAESQLSKPVETHISKDSLGTDNHDQTAHALSHLVEGSASQDSVTHGIHAHASALHHIPFVHKLLPELEKISAEHHVGNYVVVRDTGEKFFESMPIYARLGMHLLFYGKEQVKLLETKTVEQHLKEQSVREGKIYDSPESVKSIPSFIKTYNIRIDELLNPDLSSYKTFNEFFYRKLKPDARPVQNAADPAAFCSAADSRLAVFPSVDIAKTLWIKGKRFTIPNLLGVPPDSPTAQQFDGASVAVFRLAPADYHRFHSPLDGVVGERHDIPGQYYTVNPQAVNEKDFDVFTENKRAVLYLKHTGSGLPVAFVAVGALLVASIAFTAAQGQEVKKGQELGYFAYGGSTVVALFPKGLIDFDQDLLANSQVPVETLVKVGWSLGKAPAAA